MSIAQQGPKRGHMSGRNIIGEVTEAMHRFLLDRYDIGERPPRIEEDLGFTPKDREEVVYIYMYRLAQNPNLQNQKRYRQAPVFVNSTPEDGGDVYYHRPPLLIDLFYLVMCHAKFRSDLERLMGWILLTYNEATHLIYRPRKFLLPEGRAVDSIGRDYSTDADPEDKGLLMEKVSLALVDDLTVGDTINLLSLHEAPYRPFLTYRARIALDGPLVSSAGGTSVHLPRLGTVASSRPDGNTESPSGRILPGRPLPKPKNLPGPPPHFIRKNADAESESED